MAGNEIGDLKFKVDADTAPAQSRIEALKAQAAEKPATDGPFTLGKSEEEIDAWIQSLKDAKNETEGMAGAAEKGFGEGGLGGKLKATKKLYGEQIEVVQGLIGKIAAIGGIATLAYSAGKAIREFIVEALRDGRPLQAGDVRLDITAPVEPRAPGAGPAEREHAVLDPRDGRAAQPEHLRHL